MYFSLITPSRGQERSAIQQQLNERLDKPYQDHQWLWKWFPAERGASRDFLFRRYDGGHGSFLRYYVVSHRPPPEQLGSWQAQTREYEPQLEIGMQLRFELRANPTTRRIGSKQRHDVVMNLKKKLLAERGLEHWKDWRQEDDKPSDQSVMQEACRQWLQCQGEALGFKPDMSTLMMEAYNRYQEKTAKTKNAGAEDMKFSTVDFSGVLTVTNSESFYSALMKGIGSAKAFGCGLLLVKRI